MIRIFSYFRELYLIVSGFVSAFRVIFWGTFLLLLLLSVCSIIAVDYLHPIAQEIEFPNCAWCKESFKSVFRANLTLFQTVIVGDGWSLLCLPLIDRTYLSAVLLCGVVVLFHFGFANLILQVIIEKAMSERQEDQQYQLVLEASKEDESKKKLLCMIKRLDIDGSGRLSLKEILKAYDTDDGFRTLCKSLKIDRNDLAVVFHLLDEDAVGSFGFQEFAEQMHKMKSADTTSMLMFTHHQLRKLDRQSEAMCSKMGVGQKRCLEGDAIQGPRGTIVGKVVRAFGLRNADYLSKSDPYAVVSIPGSFRDETPIIKNELDPVWDHKFVLKAGRIDSLLQVEIFDADVYKKHDCLGRIAFNFRHFEPGKTQRVKQTLREGDGAEVELEVTWNPTEGDDFCDETGEPLLKFTAEGFDEARNSIKSNQIYERINQYGNRQCNRKCKGSWRGILFCLE